MTERDALEKAWKDVQEQLEAFRAKIRADAAFCAAAETRNAITRMLSDRISKLDRAHPAREELCALQQEIHSMDLSGKYQS